MLLTAQRVTAPAGKRTGVNAFRYEHGSAASGVDWNNLSRETIPQLAGAVPARLVAESIELAPGGNSVNSYLDVLAPDHTAPSVILDALRRATELLPYGNSSSVVLGSVGVFLNAALIPPEERKAEFQKLTERVIQVLVRPRESRWRRLPPLRVVAHRRSDGWLLQLDPSSSARIRARLADWRLPAVSLSDDVLNQLRALRPDFLPHVLASAAGLSPDVALELGGIELVEESGSRLQLWPDVPRHPVIATDEAVGLLGAAQQELNELNLEFRRETPDRKKGLRPHQLALETLIPRLERAGRGNQLPEDNDLSDEELEILETLRVQTRP